MISIYNESKLKWWCMAATHEGIKGRINLMNHIRCPSSLLKFSRVKYGRLFPVACLNLCFARCSSFPDTGSKTKNWTWIIVRNCQLGAFLNRNLKITEHWEMQKRQTTSCNQELGIDVTFTKSLSGILIITYSNHLTASYPFSPSATFAETWWLWAFMST